MASKVPLSVWAKGVSRKEIIPEHPLDPEADHCRGFQALCDHSQPQSLGVLEDLGSEWMVGERNMQDRKGAGKTELCIQLCKDHCYTLWLASEGLNYLKICFS